MQRAIKGAIKSGATIFFLFFFDFLLLIRPTARGGFADSMRRGKGSRTLAANNGTMEHFVFAAHQLCLLSISPFRLSAGAAVSAGDCGRGTGHSRHLQRCNSRSRPPRSVALLAKPQGLAGLPHTQRHSAPASYRLVPEEFSGLRLSSLHSNVTPFFGWSLAFAGVGRSGTHHTQHAMFLKGFDLCHEAVCTDGSVSWTYAVVDPNRFYPWEASRARINGRRFQKIVHQVRNLDMWLLHHLYLFIYFSLLACFDPISRLYFTGNS